MTASPRGERPVEVLASSISHIWSEDEHSNKTSKARFSFYHMATNIGWLFKHSCCFVSWIFWPGAALDL